MKTETLRVVVLTSVLLLPTCECHSAAGSRACENDALTASTPARFSNRSRMFVLEDSDASDEFYVLPFNSAALPNESMFPVAGDWDGDGFEGLGVFMADNASFALKQNTSTPGPPDLTFSFGWAAAAGALLPIAGDWLGSGQAGVGLWERSTGTFYLKYEPSPGPADATFVFAPASAASDPTTVPIAGDWTGRGFSTVGLYSPAAGTFFLRFQNEVGPADAVFQYGPANGLFAPLVGRWRGSPYAHDGVGVWQGDSTWFLKWNLSAGPADVSYLMAVPNSNYAGAAMLPLAGRWAPTHCRTFTEPTSPPAPPSWAAGSVFYQLRIETFSPEATFDGAIPRLAYLAALGVTAIVTTPVSEGVPPGEPIGPNTILYGVRRPDVVESSLGGGAGLARFVAAAHGLGLRVIVDNVVNGILQSSPYLPTSPDFAYGADVARRNQSGEPYIAWGANVQYDWTQPPLLQWWAQELCAKWVTLYDVDGFRIDLEPNYGNAAAWQAVRAAVTGATGKPILLMSEATPGFPNRGAGPRAWTFDVSQHDFDFAGFPSPDSPDFYGGTSSFVDAVRQCGEPQATRTLSNHDYGAYSVQGRLSAFVYGTLISPFSPHFFVGEEFNCALNFSVGGNNVLYFQLLDWDAQLTNNATHQAFLSAVTNAMHVRARYLPVFGPDPAGVRPINQSVAVDALPATGTDLEPYVFWRAASHQAISVLAKRDTADGLVFVSAFPGLTEQLNVSMQAPMIVVDLLTSTWVANATAEVLEQRGVAVFVEHGGAAVLLIEPEAHSR
jgi:hypothetical protein